jgi:hypothetical protein
MKTEELSHFLTLKAQEAETEFRDKIFAILGEWEKNSNKTIEELQVLFSEGQNNLEDEVRRLRNTFAILQEQSKDEYRQLRNKTDTMEQSILAVTEDLHRAIRAYFNDLTSKLQGEIEQALSFRDASKDLQQANAALLGKTDRQMQLSLQKQEQQIYIGENLVKVNQSAAQQLALIINNLNSLSESFSAQIQQTIAQQETIRKVYDQETAYLKGRIENISRYLLIGFGTLAVLMTAMILMILLK